MNWGLTFYIRTSREPQTQRVCESLLKMIRYELHIDLRIYINCYSTKHQPEFLQSYKYKV
jgi:hypothetical protein